LRGLGVILRAEIGRGRHLVDEEILVGGLVGLGLQRIKGNQRFLVFLLLNEGVCVGELLAQLVADRLLSGFGSKRRLRGQRRVKVHSGRGEGRGKSKRGNNGGLDHQSPLRRNRNATGNSEWRPKIKDKT